MECVEMECIRCGRYHEPVLYRCKVCYCDGETDSDMCDDCKADHIEANFENNSDTDWEIIYPTKLQ